MDRRATQRLNLDLLLLIGACAARSGTPGTPIISALRERSEGTFDLPEGTIYPAPAPAGGAACWPSSWAEAEGRKRRVYGVTDEGVAALAAQRTEWRRFARGVQAVLGIAGPGVVGMTWDRAPRDLIDAYLDELRRGLRVLPGEAEMILAEAEDHLRETAAAGLAVGMTEREAQEAAISSFGPVRAVTHAPPGPRGRGRYRPAPTWS